MKRSLIVGIMFCFICFLFIKTAEAAAQYDVRIELETDELVYENCFQSQVNIYFDDLSYYNDSLFLSYHITDDEGKMLQFENERFPIKIENGSCKIDLTFNLDMLNKKLKKDKYIINFDIVDVKNTFWFSQDKISMFVKNIQVKNSWIKANFANNFKAIKTHKLIFLINISFFIAILLLFKKLKKYFV